MLIRRGSVLLLLPALSQAAEVFDGYEAYYRSLPNRLFQSQGVELEAVSLKGEQEPRYVWRGVAAGRRHQLELKSGKITLDGLTWQAGSIQAFPGEALHAGDLGRGAVAYFAVGWACVENTPASASGTAVRHQSVYLLRLGLSKTQGWKLPSLFASCQGLSLLNGQVRFDKLEYRYQPGKAEPDGVLFNEYAIESGRFVSLAGKRSASFVEEGNVYRFLFD
ncbi:hypothetical protein [Chromobacterium aquaticum]|uniref:Uncharacterized protein n=1 Tax=Chromobacterium aquaticum TaxID=467180 RepID=A0ABV8ZT35_9NEIS|nr:hypothetical protein [Chromobacterium aquaticum]MCD5360099.1 hypothetical protein [Chromobacterium aquaticum]